MKPIKISKTTNQVKALWPQIVWYAFAFLLCMSTAAYGGQLVDRDFASRSYPHSDNRDFYVYIPDSYDGQSEIPMVMVLHGCHQDRDTVFDEFGWDEVADQFGFIVVSPDISTSDPLRNPKCWGYWEAKEIHQGQGEVEDLHQIARQVEQEWAIDPDHRHITGLSSGGFMANAAAVAHNEYWASAAVHSGGGFNETAATYSFMCANPRQSSGNFKTPDVIANHMQAEMDNDYTIPIMLMHSENDCAVGYGVEGNTLEWGGLTSNRDAWLIINGGALYENTDCSRNGIPCSHQKYGNARRSTVEIIDMVGLVQGTDASKGHYWSGGKNDGRWTETRGPRAATLFWDFFQRHPRQACLDCPAAPTGLRVIEAGQQEVSITWDAAQESRVVGYRVYRDGVDLQSAPIVQNRYADTGLEQGTSYSYQVTAIDADDQESLPSERLIARTTGEAPCQSHTATLDEHVAQGRAYITEDCLGWWCWMWPWGNVTRYYAQGSDESIGNSGSTVVTLYTLDNASFTTVDCNEVE